MRQDAEPKRELGGRASLFWAIAVIFLLVLAWQLAHLLLLTFGGILIAVFFRQSAVSLHRAIGVPIGLGLGLVVLALMLAIAAAVVWTGPQIIDQANMLSASLPGAIERARQWLSSSELGRFLLEQLSNGREMRQPQWNIVGSLGGTISSIINILFQVIICLTVAIFFAVDPGLYRRGVLHLVPMHRRKRAEEVMDVLGDGLWNWLVAQFLSMLVVGIFATAGLLLLGVPLAAVLGFIAAVTNFIPQIGPYIAAVPAVLIAFTQDPMTALYTALLFIAIHQVEGNIILPLLQKRAVDLPPVLTVVVVIAGGVLFGSLGLLLATPLLFVVMVLVRMLYVEDYLGDTTARLPSDTSPDDPAESAISGGVSGSRPTLRSPGIDTSG